MVAFRVHPSCNPTCFTGAREVQIQSMQPWLRNTVTWGCAAQNKFGGLLALWPHTSLSHSAQKVQTLMWSTRTNISRANSPQWIAAYHTHWLGLTSAVSSYSASCEITSLGTRGNQLPKVLLKVGDQRLWFYAKCIIWWLL